jgi:ankyrin repeat protein
MADPGEAAKKAAWAAAWEDIKAKIIAEVGGEAPKVGSEWRNSQGRTILSHLIGLYIKADNPKDAEYYSNALNGMIVEYQEKGGNLSTLINYQDTRGATSIFIAVLKGLRSDVLQQLLQAGGNPRIPTSTGDYPLDAAVLNAVNNPGKESMDILRLLLTIQDGYRNEAGAEISFPVFLERFDEEYEDDSTPEEVKKALRDAGYVSVVDRAKARHAATATAARVVKASGKSELDERRAQYERAKQNYQLQGSFGIPVTELPAVSEKFAVYLESIGEEDEATLVRVETDKIIKRKRISNLLNPRGIVTLQRKVDNFNQLKKILASDDSIDEKIGEVSEFKKHNLDDLRKNLQEVVNLASQIGDEDILRQYGRLYREVEAFQAGLAETEAGLLAEKTRLDDARKARIEAIKQEITAAQAQYDDARTQIRIAFEAIESTMDLGVRAERRQEIVDQRIIMITLIEGNIVPNLRIALGEARGAERDAIQAQIDTWENHFRQESVRRVQDQRALNAAHTNYAAYLEEETRRRRRNTGFLGYNVSQVVDELQAGEMTDDSALELVNSVLAKRPRLVNETDVRGRTPLMMAAQLGFRNTVQRLLQLGANPNTQDIDGHTALIHAILALPDRVLNEHIGTETQHIAQLPVIQILLPLTDTTLLDEQGLEAFDHAEARLNTMEVEIRRAGIIQAVLPLRTQRHQSLFFTEILDALERKRRTGVKKGVVGLYKTAKGVVRGVEDLLGRQTNLRAREEHIQRRREIQEAEEKAAFERQTKELVAEIQGMTIAQVFQALRDASYETRDRIADIIRIRFLLNVEGRFRIPLNQVNGGQTALHLAADAGAFEAVRLLLDAGANPNVRDAEQRTPLMLAIQGTNLRVEPLNPLLNTIAILVETSDTNLVDAEGRDAYDYARAIELTSAGVNPQVLKAWKERVVNKLYAKRQYWLTRTFGTRRGGRKQTTKRTLKYKPRKKKTRATKSH